ncbi:hypothetical protein ABZ686_02405 [Streptomyces sp. NPDC006992]|uniref:hypothetical protein n=1 Tax=Streptomyces sp. NPDC006992 TaxID=3155601 RepID=UPI0033D553EA
MTPKPDPDTRADAKQRVSDLKKTRDEIHENAEQAKRSADETMWEAIAKELDNKQLLQRDVVEATGFTRDHVLRRTKKYRNPE